MEKKRLEMVIRGYTHKHSWVRLLPRSFTTLTVLTCESSPLMRTAPSTPQTLSVRNNNLRALGRDFSRVFPGVEQLNADSNDLAELDLEGAECLLALSVAYNRWVEFW